MKTEEIPLQHLSIYRGIDPDSVLHGDLESGIVDYVTHLLRIQFPGVSGLLTPTHLYALERENKSYHNIPRSEFAVQMHVYPGHYLVSAQINGSLFVIDSLYHHQHLTSVMPQLKILYTESAVRTLRYISPQSQGNTNLCGYFSIANTYYVLLNESVPSVNFHIDQMRNHLRTCLNNSEVTPFPTEHADSVKNVTTYLPRITSAQNVQAKKADESLIEKYFSDQRKMTVLKKQTKREKYKLKLHKQQKQRQTAKISEKHELKNVLTCERRLTDKERKRKERVNMTNVEKEEIRNKDKKRKQLERKQISESEREVVIERVKDKERKRKERVNRTNLQREKVCKKDKKRKEFERKEISESKRKVVLVRDKDRKRNKRSKLTNSEKENYCEVNRLQQKNLRLSKTEDEKQTLRNKNASSHKESRDCKSEQNKKTVRVKDRLAHKIQRHSKSEQEKASDRLRNRLAHKIQRDCKSEQNKKTVRVKDRLAHKIQRDSKSEQEKASDRLRNRLAHKIQRDCKSEQNKKTVRVKDTLAHKIQRDSKSEQEKVSGRLRNRLAHKIQRDSKGEQEKASDRLRNRLAHKIQRDSKSEQEKVSGRLRNRLSHKIQRDSKSEQEKEISRCMEKCKKSSKRNMEGEERKEINREKDRMSHKKRRQSKTEHVKKVTRETDQLRQRNKRNSVREKLSNISKSSSSHLSKDQLNDALQSFFRAIADGPTYVCCSCNRFLYRSAVKRLSNTLTQNSSKIPNFTLHLSDSEISWICDTCSTSIQKCKMPCQAISNHNDVEQVPLPLKNLHSLEKQLISKIIQFMKILSLPAGSQHGFKGQVVLVPSNLQKTATALPRQTGETQIVALSLKRRLSDKYGSVRQYIRPNAVNSAITYLTGTNPHYSDVSVNDNWIDESKCNDAQFWNSVSQTTSTSCQSDSDEDIQKNTTDESQNTQTSATQTKIGENCSEKTDSEDEVDDDNPLEVVEDLSLKRSLNSTTCLYPEFGPSVPGNKVLNLAPGEGQTPVSVFYQKHWETLAFPTLFPTGKGSFHEDRQINLTPKKYVISRLLSKDPRFAESPEYTFQCLHWIESTTVADSINMSLKKSRQSLVTVRQLQDPQRVQTLFRDEELFASFKKIRGTPQYWKEMQQNMLAKIRHFGTYTFFLSGSAADFHWPELIRIVAKQYGEHYSLDYVENHMDKKTKRNWLARNPVTIARHIDFIFRKLWGNVILSGVHPIGQILNYDIRKEMQNRGTAHFHSAIHVKDALVLDKDSDDDVITFVNKYITCSVPTENEPLKELVLSRQTHHHTRTCKKKKGLNCRFHFPKPPSQTTVIARQPTGELAKLEMVNARKVLTAVMETLEISGTDITLTDLLKAANISRQVYYQALKSSLKRTSIILKRTPSESHVNPYNSVILTALRANMDIQFITDVWACVAYITSYMCKPERNMSDLMRNACKEANTAKDKLKKIGSTFLKSREVSQHEAIARLLGMPLGETNTPVLFVATGYSHQRTRILKPPQVLQKLNDDDTDIYQPNITDKYSARPDDLKKMCLAEFAANYMTTSRTCATDETLDEIVSDKEQLTSKTIKLKNGLGTMKKRQKRVILRDYPVSHEKDSEKYYHRLLLLYFPWREEDELENEGSFEEKFINHFQSIENTIQYYEPFLDEVQMAATMCDTENCDEEIWDTIAPQAEQCRLEEATEDPIFSLVDTSNLTSDQVQGDIDDSSATPQTHYQLSSHVHIEPQTSYFSMVRSLNEKQRRIHDHIFTWCRKMNLASSKEDEPDPFHIFMSGPAGVGKSHVVHTVYQTAVRNLRKAGNTPDSPTVLLTAPTGKAAVNIGGTTLHTAFHLPVRRSGSHFGYSRPSANNLNLMRANNCNLKILIIDEISMVSSKTLSHLDLCLQEIYENNEVFGGVSVLAVGDLLQLQPVGEKPVFSKEGTGYEALAPTPWDKFSLFELTDIVRQKGDPEFASMLSRIRIGKHTPSDVETLEHLQNTSVLEGTVSVFLTNSLKDSYNREQLQKLHTQVFTIKAVDSKKDLHTRRIPVTVTSSNIHQTGGLAAEIQMAENARYMHTKNTDILEGLVNGATGTIKKLEIPPQKPLSGTLYVQFDDSNVGKQLKTTCKFKGLVPIKPVSTVFSITENSTSMQVERTQFPGTLAWGITVHKAQGSTYAEMIADMTFSEKQKTTMPGQIYTMLSRSKSMDRLKLVSFKPSKILINNSALEEMKRLESRALNIEVISDQSPTECLTVSYLNVRSLKSHHEDLQHDQAVLNSHVLCLSETKVTNYTKYPLEHNTCIPVKTKHGLVVYHRSSLDATHIHVTEHLNVLEVMAVKFQQVIVISVYVAPSTSLKAISSDFKRLLHYAMNSKDYFLIIGDFNLSLAQCENLEKEASIG